MIDTHLHLWNLERGDYPWLGPELGPLNRTFDLGEIEPDLHELGVDRAVLVQAANNGLDTELMLEAADRHPWVVGVVGWVDLTEGDAAEASAERLAEDRRVVGIRHLIHNEEDPDWLLRSEVLAGLRALARVGLAFDIVSVLPRHLEHVSTVAEHAPDLRIVIDHLSKPPIASGDLHEWARLLAEAAAHPNVHAKISGLDTAASPERWTPADLRPAVDHALQVFGADRLMYGGDWPITILGGGYRRQHAAFTEIVSTWTEDEQRAVKWRTATRVYGLSGDPRDGSAS